MRDCLNNRGGFDRVLMAVAATFLTVSATSALAQDPARSTRCRTGDRCRDPAPRARQRAAADRRRFQDGHHRLDDAGRLPPSEPAHRQPVTADKPRRRPPSDQAPGYACHHACRAATAAAPSATPATAAADAKAAPAAPATAAAPAAEPREGREQRARRPISRSPTSSRTCSAPRPRAISTARPSAPRSRSSTARATTRRSGPRAAA